MQGYRVVFNSANKPSLYDNKISFSQEFIEVISALNIKNKGEIVFPYAQYLSGGNGVVFHKADSEGKEILSKTKSFKYVDLTEEEIYKIEFLVEQLHQWAEDENVPLEKRHFCREFRLPDPKKSPECYRFHKHLFSRDVYILWGLEKNNSLGFLPKTSVSKNWSDESERESLNTKLKSSWIRKNINFRNFLYLFLIFIALYFAFFYKIKCNIHGNVIAHGLITYFNQTNMEELCEHKCTFLNCGKHLDFKFECDAHVCSKCHRKFKHSDRNEGVCDECFWKVSN